MVYRESTLTSAVILTAKDVEALSAGEKVKDYLDDVATRCGNDALEGCQLKKPDCKFRSEVRIGTTNRPGAFIRYICDRELCLDPGAVFDASNAASNMVKASLGLPVGRGARSTGAASV